MSNTFKVLGDLEGNINVAALREIKKRFEKKQNLIVILKTKFYKNIFVLFDEIPSSPL